MFFLYCYENKINGKVYVGQTNDLNRRDNEHSNHEKLVVDRAIKKYGRENFDLWTFSVAETQEQADQSEIYWIAYMRQAIGNKNVYNVSDGGEHGMVGKERSEETKQKISASHTGKRRSEKAKESMRAVQNDPTHKRQRLKTIRAKYSIPDHIMEQLIIDRRSGMLVKDIAIKYGIKSSTNIPNKIRSYLFTNGLDMGIIDTFPKANFTREVGERVHNSKLKEADVIEIKKLLRSGTLCTPIAKQYGVSITTINSIQLGKTWKHIK